jgi:hypothetical protein
VALVENDAELAAAWSRMAATGDSVFAQEFVPGKVASVGGVSRGGEIVGIVSYESRPADRNPLGPAAQVRLIDLPAAVAFTRTIIGALGYTGMFGLDFVDADQPRPLLVDFNPRVFGSWAGVQRAGVDLVSQYIAAYDLSAGNGLNGSGDPVVHTPERWLATMPYGRYLGKTRDKRPFPDGVCEVGDFTRHLGWRWLTTRSTEVAFTRERAR